MGTYQGSSGRHRRGRGFSKGIYRLILVFHKPFSVLVIIYDVNDNGYNSSDLLESRAGDRNLVWKKVLTNHYVTVYTRHGNKTTPPLPNNLRGPRKFKDMMSLVVNPGKTWCLKGS